MLRRRPVRTWDWVIAIPRPSLPAAKKSRERNRLCRAVLIGCLSAVMTHERSAECDHLGARDRRPNPALHPELLQRSLAATVRIARLFPGSPHATSEF